MRKVYEICLYLSLTISILSLTIFSLPKHQTEPLILPSIDDSKHYKKCKRYLPPRPTSIFKILVSLSARTMRATLLRCFLLSFLILFTPAAIYAWLIGAGIFCLFCGILLLQLIHFWFPWRCLNQFICHYRQVLGFICELVVILSLAMIVEQMFVELCRYGRDMSIQYCSVAVVGTQMVEHNVANPTQLFLLVFEINHLLKV